jgi:hypothetical protein
MSFAIFLEKSQGTVLRPCPFVARSVFFFCGTNERSCPCVYHRLCFVFSDAERWLAGNLDAYLLVDYGCAAWFCAAKPFFSARTVETNISRAALFCVASGIGRLNLSVDVAV